MKKDIMFCLISKFWKNRVGLWHHVSVCVRVVVYPLIIARQRLGKNPLIVARQRMGKIPLIVARQRLSRKVSVVTNTHATIEILLDASFSMWSVSYQGKYAINSSQNFLLYIYGGDQRQWVPTKVHYPSPLRFPPMMITQGRFCSLFYIG
jgi:hypothetical protein